MLQETEQQQDQPDGARESVREQRRDGRQGSPHQLRPQHPLRGGAGAGESPPAETCREAPGAASLEPGAGQGQRGRGGGLGSPVEGRPGQADPGGGRRGGLGHPVQSVSSTPLQSGLRPGQCQPSED